MLLFMHYYNTLVVEADNPEHAVAEVDTFLNIYNECWDSYKICDVMPLCLDDGSVNPEIVDEIEKKLDYKDEIVSEQIAFFDTLDHAGEVLVALDPAPELKDAVRFTWSQALKTKGLSLSAHRDPENHGKNSVRSTLLMLKKVMMLMGDFFHNEVYFYDITDETPSMRNMLERVKTEPQNQWVVQVDMYM